MQRYEREVEEILRRLHFDGIAASENVQSESAPGNKTRSWWPADALLPYRPARLAGDTFVRGACVLLASALILLPFFTALSVGLIGLTFVLLFVSLKRIHLAGLAEGDLAARDLRWSDVTVPTRQAALGRPRKSQDFSSGPINS